MMIEDNNNNDLYELAGVLVHSGSAEAGHYYSYIKVKENGKWYEFNDSRISEFNP
jgi:ubiquitin C-terminal hydrolase